MDKLLREQLLAYLNKPHAHKSLLEAVADFPKDFINQKPESAPYTFWQLLYHINISQHDMVDFMINPNYQEIQWPKDYWPDPKQEATKDEWDVVIEDYQKDLETLKNLVVDPKTDLFAKIPAGTGQTIFREYLQIVDHAAYHIGELVLLRRLMGIWK